MEAGAQGEHKIQRGYLPVATHSAHYVRDPRLAEAVGRFLVMEAEEMQDVITTLGALGADTDPDADVRGWLCGWSLVLLFVGVLLMRRSIVSRRRQLRALPITPHLRCSPRLPAFTPLCIGSFDESSAGEESPYKDSPGRVTVITAEPPPRKAQQQSAAAAGAGAGRAGGGEAAAGVGASTGAPAEATGAGAAAAAAAPAPGAAQQQQGASGPGGGGRWPGVRIWSERR